MNSDIKRNGIILTKGLSIQRVRQTFQKTNISYPLILTRMLVFRKIFCAHTFCIIPQRGAIIKESFSESTKY